MQLWSWRDVDLADGQLGGWGVGWVVTPKAAAHGLMSLWEQRGSSGVVMGTPVLCHTFSWQGSPEGLLMVPGCGRDTLQGGEPMQRDQDRLQSWVWVSSGRAAGLGQPEHKHRLGNGRELGAALREGPGGVCGWEAQPDLEMCTCSPASQMWLYLIFEKSCFAQLLKALFLNKSKNSVSCLKCIINAIIRKWIFKFCP